MSVGTYVKQSAAGGMITLQPSTADLQAFTDFAAVMPKAAANAQRRAVNKVLRWLASNIARAVGKKERIAVAAVRQRLRAFPVSRNGQGKLWFGINPIEASRIGRPRQGRAGVSVAGRRYRGAFYEKVYGSRADIWIRTASKQFSAKDYPDSETGRRGTGWIRENGDRFPLAKAKVSLESVRPEFERWVRQADERLQLVLKQELNFEMQKYLKRTANA